MDTKIYHIYDTENQVEYAKLSEEDFVVVGSKDLQHSNAFNSESSLSSKKMEENHLSIEKN